MTRLGPDDYRALAPVLLGTRANVIALAAARLNYDWTDADFAALKGHAGVFRCELCDAWKLTVSEKADDICARCLGGDESDDPDA